LALKRWGLNLFARISSTHFLRSIEKSRLTALLGSVCVLAIAASAAKAQDAPTAAQAPTGTETASVEGSSPTTIETVQVTARKRSEDAQSVPIALSVIGEKQIERAGAYTLQQFEQLTPSLQIYSFNPRNTNINIRGLGSNIAITNDGLENGVGVYVDQVYYGRVGLTQFDLVDLDRVEILRGPQGTLYGKNTTAGAINIASRAPTFYPEASGEASAGDYGYYQLRGTVSGPILDDEVAGRISVSDTNHSGFIHDTTNGLNLDNYQDASVRGQLLITPTDDLTIRLIADYNQQRAKCCIAPTIGVITTYDNGLPIADNFFQKIARFPGYTPLPFAPFERKTDADGTILADMSEWGVSGQADLNLDENTLTSITAYRAWDWYPSNDTDGIGLPINTQGRIIDHQQQWSQELRLASNGQRTIDYVLGAYYFWQIIDGHTTISYGSAAPSWYLPTVPALIANAALNGFAADSISTPETYSYAAFGQANWHIADDLTLTGGLRYTHEQKQGSYENSWTAGANLALLPPVPQAIATAIRSNFGRQVPLFNAHQVDDSLSGLATLSYEVAPDILTYATYSRGNKSGGLNLTLLPLALPNPIVKPERVNNYEIGFKSELFVRTVTLNLAAYWTEVADYQTAIIDPNPPFPQSIANIPKVRSRGLEADAFWLAADWLSVTAGGNYNDAVYVKYPNGPCPTDLGPTALFPVCDLSGKPLAGAPKWTATVAADVNQPLDWRDLEGYAHADYRFQSSNFTQVTDSIFSEVGGYGLADLRIGVRTNDEKWDLSIWAKNLFGVNYFLTKSVATTGLITGLVGDPETFGVTLRARY
jgi:iron complex outermembrane receptor protein